MEKKDKDKETIKKLYEEMQEGARLNEPDIFLIPRSVWTNIIWRIEKLGSSLARVKKSRDMWRKRYDDLKKVRTTQKK